MQGQKQNDPAAFELNKYPGLGQENQGSNKHIAVKKAIQGSELSRVPGNAMFLPLHTLLLDGRRYSEYRALGLYKVLPIQGVPSQTKHLSLDLMVNQCFTELRLQACQLS